MQERNCLSFQQAGLVFVGTLLVSLSAISSAQAQGASAVAMFATAAKERTNIAGVSIIKDRPNGFNPLTASNEELGRYGLPQRPNEQADPDGFVRWTKGMQALRYRASAHLKAMPQYSKKVMMASRQPAASAIHGKPTQLFSLNWSGVASTNQLTVWNPKKSFDKVESLWNVPAAQPPFHACENGITGAQGVDGFYEANWTGIDGFSNGDVLQGGSLSFADCESDTLYIGWVEWFPSYPILEIDCDVNVACPVNPADEFFVITYGANSPTQFIFVEDITQGWYGTFALAYVTGPPLVGSSAQYIVERPCCDVDGFPLALANYISDDFALAVAFDGQGSPFLSGRHNPATAVIDMVDDGDTQVISVVKQQVPVSLSFESVNCAFSGGCVSF
jgi:Peptidase A4 family